MTYSVDFDSTESDWAISTPRMNTLFTIPLNRYASRNILREVLNHRASNVYLCGAKCKMNNLPDYGWGVDRDVNVLCLWGRNFEG